MAEVTTQAELNAALASGTPQYILIKSPRGLWLVVSDSKQHAVRASGSATVRAYDSATVRAYDSATVRAYDSATVEAYGSATVEAYDSATVEAYDSATVEAYGSATVRAYDSATVHGWQLSVITAGSYVAVHRRGTGVRITGGVVIDATDLNLKSADTWTGYTGTETEDGFVILYKALDSNLQAGHDYDKPTTYAVGSVVECDDWRDDNECGGGLHLSPTPNQARDYSRSATRFAKVRVAVEDVRPIIGGTAKAKVRRCMVVEEVDSFARPLAAK